MDGNDLSYSVRKSDTVFSQIVELIFIKLPPASVNQQKVDRFGLAPGGRRNLLVYNITVGLQLHVTMLRRQARGCTAQKRYLISVLTVKVPPAQLKTFYFTVSMILLPCNHMESTSASPP